MKGLKKLLFTLLLVLPSIVLAAGSVTVNKTSISIANGEATTFTITAKNSAGKVTIKSNNTSVVTVNKSSEWIEKNSLTVTVKSAGVGSTTITVDVNAATFDEEPIKKTYTIKVDVTKPKSSNNNLASLTIDGKPAAGFAANKTQYTLSSTKANSISIEAKAADEKAKVSGTGTKNLRYGKNTFNVVVQAENGAKKTYRVSITKIDERNSDNTLKSLSVDVGNIDFNKNTTNYTLKVDHSVTSVNIKADVNNSASKLTGTGTKTLKDYVNSFSIVVTAENQTKRTYTIKILRADADGNYGKLSTDNDLKNLSIENYKIQFNKDTLEYELTVEEDVESLEIKADSSSTAAEVEIVGNENLKAGNNEVKINVTAENGETKTYVLKVFKKGEVEPEKEEDTKPNDGGTKKDSSKEKEDSSNILGFNAWTIISAVLFIINMCLLLANKKLMNQVKSKKK